MLPEEKQTYIESIKTVLRAVHIVPLATVSPSSRPHNTPVFMAFDRNFNAIWSSTPLSQHSQNIARTGEAFLSIFDSRGQLSGGLYIDAKAAVVEHNDPDFMQAYTIFAEAKRAFGAAVPQPEHFTKPDGQRLYCAVPDQLWINASQKDKDGNIVLDQRFRVTVASLQDK